MASGFQSDGQYHIEITGKDDPVGPGGTGGSNNGGGNSSMTSPTMTLHNGQMGYWEDRTTGAGNNEHTTRIFIAVGPSEAEKAAAAAKVLQEKQQAEAAAKAFAAQVAAIATTAEQGRQAAIAAATAAGQHQSVSDAQTALNNATAEASRLKGIADTALQTAQQKRQSATLAGPAADLAEKKYQELSQRVHGLTVKNGQYGSVMREVIGSNAEHDHYGNVFHSSGITTTEVETARVDAVNKRSLANTLPGEASAAEQASLNAAADYQAAETRRQAAAAALTAAQQAADKAAEAELQRQAAEKSALDAAEQERLANEAAKAAEAARVAAEQEKVHQARQAAADKLKSTDIQSVRGISATAAPAAFPLAWSVASGGGISLGSDVAGAVWSHISAALTELRGIMAASMVGPVAVTVAGLLYSRDVGVGSDVVPGRDISTLMPGDALGLPDTTALNNAADAKTPVSMPVRGRMILRSDGTLETQLVRTPVAGNVPVVRGVLDAETGYWGYTLPMMPGVPGQTILVSPSDAPGVNGPLGLTGPVPLPEKIVHTGGQDSAPQGVKTTTTPVLGDLDFRDFILTFPDSALLKPLYVMQNSPYGDATEKGEHSGRAYNPDKAGGPVQNLDWHGAVIDQAGIDKVKLHTGRFGDSADNKEMINRLEKILSGQLQVTDTDKRFYTHEIRELERYRALGVPDNVAPDDGGITWNNTHTATLEDYKVNDDPSLLYTPEATKAYEEQEWENNK